MLDISIQSIEPDKHKIIAGGPYLCETRGQQTCWDEKKSVLEEGMRNFLKFHGLMLSSIGTVQCAPAKVRRTRWSLCSPEGHVTLITVIYLAALSLSVAIEFVRGLHYLSESGGCLHFIAKKLRIFTFCSTWCRRFVWQLVAVLQVLSCCIFRYLFAFNAGLKLTGVHVTGLHYPLLKVNSFFHF